MKKILILILAIISLISCEEQEKPKDINLKVTFHNGKIDTLSYKAYEYYLEDGNFGSDLKIRFLLDDYSKTVANEVLYVKEIKKQ